MFNFTYFYDKLLNFYNVNTLKDLSEVTNIPISTMSSIKQRNSITALKKKCRELGIYDEIFGDLNSNTTINQGNNSRAAGKNYIESGHSNEKEINFDNITIGLIKKAIEKFGSEEIAYKSIWTILVFSTVKMLLINHSVYQNLIDIFNLPRETFTTAIHSLIRKANNSADIENIINSLYSAQTLITKSIFDKGGITDIAPFIYGIIVWFSGSLLMLVIILNTVFSIFLSEIVLALLPLILPTLIWKKTEYVFFSWVKLYISISLYAPFTILFGLVSIKVVDLTMVTAKAIDTSFEQNIQYILVLILAQGLVIIAVFKIPNIINQLIGSSNEGSSLTSGVGTLSAGGAMVSTFSKYTGLKFAGQAINKTAKSAGVAIVNRVKDTLANKVQIR